MNSGHKSVVRTIFAGSSMRAFLLMSLALENELTLQQLLDLLRKFNIVVYMTDA